MPGLDTRGENLGREREKVEEEKGEEREKL